jgi:hypothetical protein
MVCLNLKKCLLAVALGLVGASYGQVLTVTSPTEASYLGQTNQIKFTVTSVNVEVTITATITGPGGVITLSDRFTPNADQKIDSQLQMNFSESTPSGAYTIQVEGKRNDNQAVFGNVLINVTVDVAKPKFLQFNPIANAFVRGIVPINVKVLELNFKDYRVQINGQDIPGNTGTTLVGQEFTVSWDTGGIIHDGEQTIAIRLRDLAQNEANQSVTVTLDRIPPSATITQPQVNVKQRRHSDVSVSIDIADSSTSAVSFTGVDVVARTLGGAFLKNVARSSFRAAGGNISRWTGKLKWSSILPNKFKIVVNARDKAGNVGTQQEIIVEYK